MVVEAQGYYTPENEHVTQKGTQTKKGNDIFQRSTFRGHGSFRKGTSSNTTGTFSTIHLLLLFQFQPEYIDQVSVKAYK